jgi:hypothetical protein
MAIPTPYAELEPVRWRNILAKGAIYHALRTRLVALGDLVEQGGPVQGAFIDLAMHVNDCAARDLDDEETVRRVVAAWDAVLTNKLGMAQLEDDVRELLTAARTLARHACATDPFRRMFEQINRYAGAIYGEGWRPPTLMLAHILGHPRSSTPKDDPYVVTAMCTPSSGDADIAAVQLLICCDEFGPAAYAAVPSLLVHELVCHVAAKQDLVKNDSVFAEGLMDWAAYYYLDMWASKIDAGLSQAARMHAQKLRDLLVKHGTAEGRARKLGHAGAETLRTWFECEFDRDADEAKATVSWLAVRLNQVDRPLVEKEVFVTKLSDPMPPDLETALRMWDADRDTEALLAAAVAT